MSNTFICWYHSNDMALTMNCWWTFPIQSTALKQKIIKLLEKINTKRKEKNVHRFRKCHRKTNLFFLHGVNQSDCSVFFVKDAYVRVLCTVRIAFGYMWISNYVFDINYITVFFAFRSIWASTFSFNNFTNTIYGCEMKNTQH